VENSKIYSLKKSSDFLFLSKNGKKLKPTKWLTIQYLDAESTSTYVGVTASKKVGSAVIRNKLKRWVRNSVRSSDFIKQFLGKKVVFVFRPQTEDFYKSLLFTEFKEAITELRVP
jgi:ribonuclease P protein component